MRHVVSAIGLSAFVLVGCSANADPTNLDSEGGFSSNQATLLDFEFDGELLAVETQTPLNENNAIQAQLLYTIGMLNGDRSVGRLDTLDLSNVKKTPAGDHVKLTYHAKFAVAWASKDNLPSEYTFVLPRDLSDDGINAFATSYMRTCVGPNAHDVDAGSFWYDYRPREKGCSLKSKDIVELKASAKKSVANTNHRYPEYQEIWADNRLEIVAIFGKYDATAATNDVGIDGFNKYVAMMKKELGSIASNVVTTPKEIKNPAPSIKDVTVEATLRDGKTVKVTALLVDAITSVWDGFDTRYESLTPTADVIVYNGHAGLGQNVRALAQKGRWYAKKYQIFFMNGCDTFAYVDGSLAQLRSMLNADDREGTKYMEFVTNAMPSMFSSMPAATTAFTKGMLSYEKPKTYDQIFAEIDPREVVLVTGEEDNVFSPGMKIGGTRREGKSLPYQEASVVMRDREKRMAFRLPAGSFTIELSGDGDADLYVKKGAAPSDQDFDCRPFEPNTAETCTLELAEATNVHFLVRGNAELSDYKLSIVKQ